MHLYHRLDYKWLHVSFWPAPESFGTRSGFLFLAFLPLLHIRLSRISLFWILRIVLVVAMRPRSLTEILSGPSRPRCSSKPTARLVRQASCLLDSVSLHRFSDAALICFLRAVAIRPRENVQRPSSLDAFFSDVVLGPLGQYRPNLTNSLSTRHIAQLKRSKLCGRWQ